MIPRNERYNPSYQNLTFNKNSVTHFVFFSAVNLFFRILRSWKARFSHRSISSHELCTTFSCLEISNRVRNWNIIKKNIYVRSNFLLCQLEIPIFINKLMCNVLLINSVLFAFCEFNRVASWNEGKTIILVR